MLSSNRIRGPTRFGKAPNLIFPRLSSQNIPGFDNATILSPSFHILRKERLAQWPAFCVLKYDQKFRGGYLNPNPISDQTLWYSLPYFRPEALEPRAWLECMTSCYDTYTVVGVNIKREMVLSPNDEEVANSSKKHTQFKTECTNHTLFQTKTAKKTYPLAQQIPI